MLDLGCVWKGLSGQDADGESSWVAILLVSADHIPYSEDSLWLGTMVFPPFTMMRNSAEKRSTTDTGRSISCRHLELQATGTRSSHAQACSMLKPLLICRNRALQASAPVPSVTYNLGCLQHGIDVDAAVANVSHGFHTKEEQAHRRAATSVGAAAPPACWLPAAQPACTNRYAIVSSKGDFNRPHQPQPILRPHLVAGPAAAAPGAAWRPCAGHA